MDEIQTGIVIKLIAFVLDLIIIIFNLMTLQKLSAPRTSVCSRAVQTCSKDLHSDAFESDHFCRNRKFFGAHNEMLRPAKGYYTLNPDSFKNPEVAEDILDKKRKRKITYTSHGNKKYFKRF